MDSCCITSCSLLCN